MLEFRKRQYLLSIYSDEYLKYPPTNINMADYHAYYNLQVADYLYNMSEDELYWDSSIPEINSHQDVIETFDQPIRGTGQGIELDPVIVPKGYNFIGDIMSKMPLDVSIYKGKTGIGGTTLAILDKRKWIICVGSKDIVKSKSEKHANTLGVYSTGHGGASNKDISLYTGNAIITTWASLGRVIDNIDIEDWSLLIDENQELIRDGGFRSEDINNVLRNMKLFKHVTLISATEIKPTNYLGFLKNMDTLRFKWEEKKEIDIDVIETSVLINSIAQLCLTTIEDPAHFNKHVFFNSVEGIIKVVMILEKVLGTDLSDKISIITSNKSTNIEKLRKIDNGKYEIGTLDDVRRINFYTSTCFSGVDIEDDYGDIIIAVNGKMKHTKLDLKNDILQIIGRPRNPNIDMKIYLLFTKVDSRKVVNLEDYNKSLKNEFADAKKTVKWYNNLSPDGKELLKNKATIDENSNLQFLNGKARVNVALFLHKNKSYQKDHILYNSFFTAIKKETVIQGDETYVFNNDGIPLTISKEISETDETTTVKRGASFKTKLSELLDEMDDDSWKQTLWDSTKPHRLKTRKKWTDRYKNNNNSLFEKYTFLEDAFMLFSPGDIRKIGLNKKDLKIAVGKKQGVSNIMLIRQQIKLDVGNKYTPKEIKTILNKAITNLGIDKKVASTFIKKIFPQITFKNYLVDKEVEIKHDEYWKIKRSNYNLPKKQHTIINYDRANGIYYKTAKNGGRKKMYVLPF